MPLINKINVSTSTPGLDVTKAIQEATAKASQNGGTIEVISDFDAPTTALDAEKLIREQTVQSSAIITKIIGTKDGNGSNVRAGAGTNTEILTALPDGTSVEVIDNGKDGWLHIRTQDGIEGYIKSDYLTDSNNNNANDTG